MDDKELLECTFTPKLINPQRSAKKNQVATHDRLYAEAILRHAKQEHVRKAKEDMERKEELEGCTFAPELVKAPQYSGGEQVDVVERLYTKDKEVREQHMEHLKREMAKAHPFKPKVKKNKQYNTSNGDIIERLCVCGRPSVAVVIVLSVVLIDRIV
jgi:hypothetical protein